MVEDDFLLPIRMVECLEYCPRQAWYRFVANEESLNWHMERGLARHRTFEEGERPSPAVYRHVPVVAPVLGVRGVLDEVRVEDGELVITEVKTARLAPLVWPGIVMQLAVQRLALAEQIERGDWYGPPAPQADHWRLRVYFAGSRTYRDVAWDADLAVRAKSAVAQARALLDLSTPPPGRVGRRCHDCQLLHDCLPFDLAHIREIAG